VPDILGLYLYLAWHPNDVRTRQPAPGPIDHGRQAPVSDGLPAGLGPRNRCPAGQQARRATEAVPRAFLALCEQRGWARGGTSKAAHAPDTLGLWSGGVPGAQAGQAGLAVLLRA
jgi:hypothetical protein